MNEQVGLFWLHVKKSAGSSVREDLGGLYVQSDRSAMPRPARITDLPPDAWNDGLNNFRFDLGAMQFTRCRYAREHLYPDAWDGMFRFAFSREPVSRAISMFDYLFGAWSPSRKARAWRQSLIKAGHLPLARRLAFSREGRFDLFLDVLEWQEKHRFGPDPSFPIDLHFSTHTNPMSHDVEDDQGQMMLSHVYRLEHYQGAMAEIHAAVGRPMPAHLGRIRHNMNRRSGDWKPSPAQIRRIEALHARDFDIHENALCPG